MRARAIALTLLFVAGTASASFAQGYDALVREAETKIAAQQWAEALALYEKAFATGEFAYEDFYNAACAATRLGKTDAGYAYLFKAIDAGLLETDALEDDPDLAPLRTGNRWRAVMDSAQAKLESIEKTFPETRAAGPVVELPAPRLDGTVSVEAALKNRRSIRSYSKEPLKIAEISQLLWAAYGITKTAEKLPPFLRGGFRTAPSAGGRFPLDLYLAAFDVTGLPPGVYWYDSEKHRLVRTVEGNRRKELSEAAFNQSQFETASAAIVYSAVYERTTVKYGRRGRDRYVCMDLGHSAENVYLQAYALNAGTCAIGAFTDLWLKKAVGMTRAEEPLYIMPLGKVE
jgi:SagB-type dehydrogenase family enzyme